MPYTGRFQCKQEGTILPCGIFEKCDLFLKSPTKRARTKATADTVTQWPHNLQRMLET